MSAKNNVLLATAAAHGLLSLGHTVSTNEGTGLSTKKLESQTVLIEKQTKGLDQFKHPSLSQLPGLLRAAVKVGWYEGSVFFAIAGKKLHPIS